MTCITELQFIYLTNDVFIEISVLEIVFSRFLEIYTVFKVLESKLIKV